MKRKRNDCGIYTFLEGTGALEHGTAEEIEALKKQYWDQYRREYKKKRRQESKSYTVFFTNAETKRISKYAKDHGSSITGLIKQATLCAINNNTVINKNRFGELREAIILHYSSLQTLQEEKIFPDDLAETLLQQIICIETTAIALFKNS